MKNKNIKHIIKLLFLFFLILALLAPSACAITENSGPKLINSPAPDFTLKYTDGRSVKLSSLLGKTVVINFWATTCPPCVAEMPIFQQLYDEWSGRNDVVFLSIDLGEDSAKVKLFMDTRHLTFPVLLDPNFEAGQYYQVHYTPSTCLIDSQGYLKFMVVGAFQNKAALDKQLAGFVTKP